MIFFKETDTRVHRAPIVSVYSLANMMRLSFSACEKMSLKEGDKIGIAFDVKNDMLGISIAKHAYFPLRCYKSKKGLCFCSREVARAILKGEKRKTFLFDRLSDGIYFFKKK